MGDRRVILIKGDGSKWYDEVIFIVKSGAEIPTSPVIEAERIVKNYIASKYGGNIPKFNNSTVKKNDLKRDYNLKKVDKIGKSKVNDRFVNKVIDICLILILITLAVLVFFAVS